MASWNVAPAAHDSAFRVLIIGAGFSGLGLACRLRTTRPQTRFLVLEKGSSIGGTWYWNQYPGAACDIVSHLYSYSWFPNPRWSSLFPSQPEILEYLHTVTDHYRLADNIRLGTEVVEARWLSDKCMWRVITADQQQYFAHALVSGCGGLHTPKYPNIPGRESFTGKQMHTTRWDKSYSEEGRRLAVIGSGASAVQLVPEVRKKAERVVVVQRTPNWFVPREDGKYSERRKDFYARFPLFLMLVRWFYYLMNEILFFTVFMNPDSFVAKQARKRLTNFIRESVHDEALVQKLVPSYAPGCKRILVTNYFFEALNEPNVHLETTALAAIEPDGLLMADGTKHQVDTIVWATGFDVISGFPTVYGRNDVELNQQWQGGDGIVTYLGITVPDFPNFFVFLGPSTALGHNSVVIMIEAQIEYTLQCFQHLAASISAGQTQAIEVKREVANAFQAWVAQKIQGRVWSKGGCASWYKTTSGTVYTLWPDTTWAYRWATRRANIARDFNLLSSPK